MSRGYHKYTHIQGVDRSGRFAQIIDALPQLQELALLQGVDSQDTALLPAIWRLKDLHTFTWSSTISLSQPIPSGAAPSILAIESAGDGTSLVSDRIICALSPTLESLAGSFAPQGLPFKCVIGLVRR